MPLFSIVIPTRNRAHWLRYSLQGALAQDFTDYEIIVSDNASSDNTRELVRELGNDRVKYVNTGKFLTLLFSWEFAIRQACGDYILLQGDDDCLTPGALRKVAQALEKEPADIVECGRAKYYYTGHRKAGLANGVVIHPFSSQLLRLDAREELAKMFRFEHKVVQPVTFLARRLIWQTIERLGWFFPEPFDGSMFADHVALALAFSQVESSLYLDEPLVLVGLSGKSVAPRQIALPSNAQAQYEDPIGIPRFAELPQFAELPLKGDTWFNRRAASWVLAKAIMPERFEGIELGMHKYLTKYWKDLQAKARQGGDIEEEQAEFWQLVSTLPVELQKNITQNIHLKQKPSYGLTVRLRALARIIISRAPPLQAVEHRLRVPKYYLVHGDKAGFSDIYGCAQQLERICGLIKQGAPFIQRVY